MGKAWIFECYGRIDNFSSSNDNQVILDSSATLALLNMEQGHKLVAKHLNNAMISSVNFSEVLTVLGRKGFEQQEIARSLKETFLNIEEFNAKQAIIAASLDEITKIRGLSFGDRACLALAKYKNLPVLTADKIFGELELDIEVKIIRG